MCNTPRTLTRDEEKRLLAVTASCLRDHAIVYLALKTGLREHEILALNVGQVFDGELVRRAVELVVFKRSNQDDQYVFLNHDGLREKLTRLYREKKRLRHDMSDAAPLFVSREGNRLSARALRHAFTGWQKAAGFDRSIRFHDLRHTACTRHLHLAGGNIRATQRFARHKTITSTQIYTHVDDEYLYRLAGKM